MVVIANKELAEREQELQASIEAANSELQKDKQRFLEEMDVAIAQYQSKIDLLESEIDELRSLLAQYEAPALPEGSSFEIILVRHCMELLLRKRVVCEFKGVGIDPDGYVVTRLKPQDGGQKAIEKWANYLHIEMELAEAAKLPPFGAIRQMERDWIGYLYCFHDPPVRNQKALILRVWGYKSGDSSGYRSARARLRTILIDAGIEIKKRVNHE
ncbi:hypothetical protein [uncultured Nostoc sp.]|uniref:hypothetical protein n=1 Tax=uncultured Nostoc sp. TaxID=340711 RepID=UPI0035C9818E